MENIKEVEKYNKALGHSIDDLDVCLEKVLSKSLDEKVVGKPALERLNTINSYSYLLASVYFSYLKAAGVDTENHEIMKDLSRVKTYMAQHKELEQRANKKEEHKHRDAEKTKEFVKSQLRNESAISKVNFKGKHTKFEDAQKDDGESSKKKRRKVSKKAKEEKK